MNYIDILLNQKMNINVKQIWVAIGPEGGWTHEENDIAVQAGWDQVNLGESILTTSTASIAAIHAIVSCRRLFSLKI